MHEQLESRGDSFQQIDRPVENNQKSSLRDAIIGWIMDGEHTDLDTLVRHINAEPETRADVVAVVDRLKLVLENESAGIRNRSQYAPATVRAKLLADRLQAA